VFKKPEITEKLIVYDIIYIINLTTTTASAAATITTTRTT